MQISVKCIVCKAEKTLNKPQSKQPICDKCFGPMIPVSTKT